MNNADLFIFLVGIFAGITLTAIYNNETTNNDKKAVIWTADYIHNTQLADSINKYAQKGYEIELLTMDTITYEGLAIMRMAMKKDIRALPYVEIKER